MPADESNASAGYFAEYHPHLREAAAYTVDERMRRAFEVRRVRGVDAGGLQCCLPEARRGTRAPADQEQCPMCEASCHQNCLDQLRNEEMRRGRPLAYGCPRCGTLWRTDSQTAAAAAEHNWWFSPDYVWTGAKPHRYRHDPISGRYECIFAPPSSRGQPCGWTVNTTRQIRKHHDRAHEDAANPCCSCPGVPPLATAGEATTDGVPPPGFCPFCTKQSRCRHAAAAHCREEHRDTHWPPVCQICQTKFDKYLDLIEHLPHAHQTSPDAA